MRNNEAAYLKAKRKLDSQGKVDRDVTGNLGFYAYLMRTNGNKQRLDSGRGSRYWMRCR